jgi:transporter family-2 protein
MLRYIFLAAASGFFLPLQALVNARTSHVLGSTLWATMINFIGGALMLAALLVATRVPVPTLEEAGRVPPYGWVSGFMGMFFVAQAAFTVPKLGAATMMALVIAGQMFGSMTYDYLGVLQTPHTIGSQKILGVLLLIAGVWLMLPRAQ